MEVFLHYAWLIPVFPLLAFAIITLTPIRHHKTASGWLAIGFMGVATLVALGLLVGVAQGLVLAEDGTISTLHTTDHTTNHTTAEHQTTHAGEAVEAEGEHGEVFEFPPPNVVQRFAWVPLAGGVFPMGVYIDPLAAIVLVMVTITSTCIHLFSLGYMAKHARQSRFFSFISLFTAAMLGMVMADNLLLFFICWEIMGLCSYLLIGFLYERPQACRAGVKAFVTTRVGDVLMLIGIAYLYTQTGSLAFGMQEGEIFNPNVLHDLASGINVLGMSHATAIALLLFAGTVGKSAQFPLHVWLPDAMEGPTPVSALIHAATMVSAGVFLVGRTFPLFKADDGSALLVVSVIGAFTALFAASMAVAQFDIKRILAYSTLSQLGFMVAALGIGGWVAGMFHMLTHAFFKALLFLGSGSIIHAMEETKAIEDIHHRDEYAAQQTAQDIRNMGNLKQYMPWTFWTYTAGYLALAGIIPFAGFWSKDEILTDAFQHGHYVVYSVLTVAAFLTAFYMTRQWRMVFFGSYRGETPRVFVNPEPVVSDIHHNHADPQVSHGHGQGNGAHQRGEHRTHLPTHPHESPWTIVAPLVILAWFAVAAGFMNLPFSMPGGHWLSDFLGQKAASFNVVVAGLSLAVAGGGMAAAWFYARAFTSAHDADPLEKRLPIFNLLHNKYYIDELYASTIKQLTYASAVAWSWFDRQVLDRIINGTGLVTLFVAKVNFIIDDTVLNDGPDSVGKGTIRSGEQVRRSQTGKIHDYLGFVFGGVVVLGLVYLYGVLK